MFFTKMALKLLEKGARLPLLVIVSNSHDLQAKLDMFSDPNLNLHFSLLLLGKGGPRVPRGASGIGVGFSSQWASRCLSPRQSWWMP